MYVARFGIIFPRVKDRRLTNGELPGFQNRSQEPEFIMLYLAPIHRWW